MLGCGDIAERTQGLPAPFLLDAAACQPENQDPYGACYPTTDLGDAPGDRLANDCTEGLPTAFCWSGFYDPEQQLGQGDEGLKLLVITTAAIWATSCSEETDFITGSNASGANLKGTSWLNEFAPAGVVFAQFLVGATPAAIATWVTQHDAQSIYEGYASDDPLLSDGAAIPTSVYVDLRSMEILAVTIGFDIHMDATIQQWLSWIATHAPMTPP